ncbi:YbbC/YhhH family protein [Propionivibrio sp.]|uniref:YbbC/YhhH family protein n=1 Tax=Propionivibrio sp. TaxID=2212460 RepID=UPI003BF3ABFA
MSKRTLIIAIALLLFAPWAYSQPLIAHNFKPAQGYVPDAATAIKIAVAVWEPIYGQENISQQKPYTAVLVNGIWIVEGTLPKHLLGGVAVAEIAKDDGRVLRVSHGKINLLTLRSSSLPAVAGTRLRRAP